MTSQREVPRMLDIKGDQVATSSTCGVQSRNIFYLQSSGIWEHFPRRNLELLTTSASYPSFCVMKTFSVSIHAYFTIGCVESK